MHSAAICLSEMELPLADEDTEIMNLYEPWHTKESLQQSALAHKKDMISCAADATWNERFVCRALQIDPACHSQISCEMSGLPTYSIQNKVSCNAPLDHLGIIQGCMQQYLLNPFCHPMVTWHASYYCDITSALIRHRLLNGNYSVESF